MRMAAMVSGSGSKIMQQKITAHAALAILVDAWRRGWRIIGWPRVSSRLAARGVGVSHRGVSWRLRCRPLVRRNACAYVAGVAAVIWLGSAAAMAAACASHQRHRRSRHRRRNRLAGGVTRQRRKRNGGETALRQRWRGENNMASESAA